MAPAARRLRAEISEALKPNRDGPSARTVVRRADVISAGETFRQPFPSWYIDRGVSLFAWFFRR